MESLIQWLYNPIRSENHTFLNFIEFFPISGHVHIFITLSAEDLTGLTTQKPR